MTRWVPKIPPSLFLLALGVGLSGYADQARFHFPKSAAGLFAPPWRRCFVRTVGERTILGVPEACAQRLEGGSEHIDPHYLLNQADALRYFYAWYRADAPVAYLEMLAAQHRISCLGPEGNRTYAATRGVSQYLSDSVFPGRLRTDAKAEGLATVNGDIFNLTEEDWRELADAGFPQARRRREVAYSPEIRGLDAVHRPTNQIMRGDGGFQIMRQCPEGEAEKAFRVLAETRMGELREFRGWTHDQAVREAGRVVDALADAYHTSIQWMPFSSINNSLLMGQVNVILMHLGFTAMPHGRLDYRALTSSTPVFRKIFRKAFSAANPGVL